MQGGRNISCRRVVLSLHGSYRRNQCALFLHREKCLRMRNVFYIWSNRRHTSQPVSHAFFHILFAFVQLIVTMYTGTLFSFSNVLASCLFCGVRSKVPLNFQPHRGKLMYDTVKICVKIFILSAPTILAEGELHVIDELFSDPVDAIVEISALFKVENNNEKICAASSPMLVADVARIADQAPEANGVVFFGSGFGNEINTIMKAMLVALAVNRTLCAHEMKTRTMEFIASSSLSSAFHPSRRSACAVMKKNYTIFTSVDRAPRNKRIAINTGNWIGKDHGFRATEKLARVYGIEYSEIRACVGNILFRPNNEVRRSMSPYLRFFRDVDVSLGVHLRSGDHAMSLYQGYDGKSVSRRGSITEEALSKKIIANFSLGCMQREDAPTSMAVFVSSDRITDTGVWRNLTSAIPNVTVLKTPGHPVHTGRSATNISERQGSLKAVTDFFLLTEVEWFASNVNYANTIGNTYTQNVHLRRTPGSEKFEIVAPHYDCQYYLSKM